MTWGLKKEPPFLPLESSLTFSLLPPPFHGQWACECGMRLRNASTGGLRPMAAADGGVCKRRGRETGG